MRQRLVGLFFLAIAMGVSGCRSGKVDVVPSPGGKSPTEQGIKLTSEQRQSNLLEFVSVHREVLNPTLEVLGTVASDTERVSQVRPDHNGHIQQILVGVGQPVTKGQELLRYLSVSSGSTTVRAPQGGVVLGVYAEGGDYVDSLVPVVTIADTSRLRCIFDIYEKDISRVHQGQKVQVKVNAFPEEHFAGTLAYVSPRVNETSRTVKVRVDVANPEGKLKFGMLATGYISLGERSALAVPESAIQKIDGKDQVFVLIDGDTLMPRPIEMGQRLDGKVEVKSGLEEGTTVIGAGSFILQDEWSRLSVKEPHG